MFKTFFARKSDKSAAELLYDGLVLSARRPFLYQNNPELDTIDGRFNLLSLHAILVIRRLNQGDQTAKDFAQSLFDVMFKDMEAAIREIGAGDTTVGKKIRVMAEAFYGAAKAYETGLEAGDSADLSQALARNVFDCSERDDRSDALAAYALEAQNQLNSQDLNTFLTGQAPQFPDEL